MALYYHEAKVLGKWTARTTPAPIETVSRGGRTFEKKAEASTHEVRAMSKINPGHEYMTLADLAEVYGPEGRFYNGAGIRKENENGNG